jgi:hypothetical protein
VKITENMGLAGRVDLVLRDKNGKIKAAVSLLIDCMVNTGFAAIAGLIGNVGSIAAFTYVEIGTGTTAAQPTDTALQTAIKRKSGTMSRVTTTVTNDTIQAVATFSSGDGLSGSSDVTETGFFNAAATGIMAFRQTFAAKPCNWDGGDTLEMTLKVQSKQGA